MENKSQRQARETRLSNELRRNIADRKWTLTGTEFSRFDWLGLYAEQKFGCWFYCNLKQVRVRIEGSVVYDLPDIEQTFKGDEAWRECIDWTVSKIIEMTDIIRTREEEAKSAYAKYLNALKGV